MDIKYSDILVTTHFEDGTEKLDELLNVPEYIVIVKEGTNTAHVIQKSDFDFSMGCVDTIIKRLLSRCEDNPIGKAMIAAHLITLGEEIVNGALGTECKKGNETSDSNI